MAVFLFVSGFATVLWPKVEPVTVPMREVAENITVSTNVRCELDINLLRKLGVHHVADYTRREVLVHFTDRPVLMRQKADQPLLDMKPKVMREINRNANESQDGCSIPTPVEVLLPRPPKPADASHIDFGVATTVGRLNDSLDAFAHWAADNRARIFAIVEPEDGIDEVLAKADTLGINLSVQPMAEDFLWRYFALIQHLNKHARPQTQWSVIIDDDTFFLSMSALIEGLKDYDHNERMYVGGISEGAPQIGIFGIMAFGGAGIFLSRPLLSELVKFYNECSMMGFEGDRRIAYCIYQNTGTRLTIDHRMRQLDLKGDVSGFFESGKVPPLSVHHWKSWFHADMAKLSVVSEVCGDSCLLRQWRFSDGWTLTNGFSVVRYTVPPELGDYSIEHTWDSENGATDVSYLHELSPLRHKDEDKVSYLHRDSVVNANGSVTQWYVMEDEKYGDRVLELNWRKR